MPAVGDSGSADDADAVLADDVVVAEAGVLRPDKIESCCSTVWANAREGSSSRALARSLSLFSDCPSFSNREPR